MINVTQTGTITDVNITDLYGLHDYIEDLKFTLTSPSGTTITLIDQRCGNDFDLKLDDAAASVIICPLTGGNTYRPEGRFSAFNGENPNGNWILTIEDLYEIDGGSLGGWALEICVGGTSTPCEVTNLSVNDDPIIADGYISCGMITSTGRVAANTTIVFKAETSIISYPGFQAESGCNFTAMIEACANSLEDTPPAARPRQLTRKSSLKLAKSNPDFNLFPNPFRNSTTISYQLQQPSMVVINLLDVNGKRLQEIKPPSFVPSGTYQLELVANKLNAGMYFVEFQTDSAHFVQKLMLVR